MSTSVATAATFEHVQKTYRSGLFARELTPAVKNVSLTIPTGSVFGLLGPNRAGKTTLVKLLLSLSGATSGAMTRLGEPVSKRHTLARIGYMHENHAFPRYLSASEVLHFYGGMSGLTTPNLVDRVPKLLERVGLGDRGQEPIQRFSKGMVQRLGLAQAIINDPDFLILDEPTEGLDLMGRQLLREVIAEFRNAKKTVLLVSHVLAEVEELCDELAVIVSGQVAYRGNLHSLIGPPGPGRQSLEAALRKIYQEGGPS
ncbi:MAG: ABC transporter ATP-binding protein [Fimbriiglobus sp.]